MLITIFDYFFLHICRNQNNRGIHFIISTSRGNTLQYKSSFHNTILKDSMNFTATTGRDICILFSNIRERDIWFLSYLLTTITCLSHSQKTICVSFLSHLRQNIALTFPGDCDKNTFRNSPISDTILLKTTSFLLPTGPLPCLQN